MNKFIVTMIAACTSFGLGILSLTGTVQAQVRQTTIQHATLIQDRAPASMLHQAQYYPERRYSGERHVYPRRDFNRRHYRPDNHRPYRYDNRPHYRPYYQPAPPRYYRERPHRTSRSSHVNWCHNRYRSYRAYDNTFQPNHGPRRQCYSPYI